MKPYISRSFVAGFLAVSFFAACLAEPAAGQILRRLQIQLNNPLQRTDNPLQRTNTPSIRTNSHLSSLIRAIRQSAGSTSPQPTSPHPTTPAPAAPAPAPEAPPVDPDPAPMVAPTVVTPATATPATPQDNALSPAVPDQPDKALTIVPESSGRYALLIGVNDYISYQPLNYCVADVTSLAERLKKMNFRVDLLTSGRGIKNEPLKGNIERRLDTLFQQVMPEDMVFIAFSGHGIRIGGQSYFCPSDADAQDPGTLVSVQSMLDRLNQNGRFRMLLVDACRNDLIPIEGRLTFNADASKSAFAKSLVDADVPEGTVLMMSCLPEEISYEQPSLGHGVFMYHVLKGLEGEADGIAGAIDNQVSLFELRDYVYRMTTTYVFEHFEKTQRPSCNVDPEMPDFVLCRAEVSRIIPPPSTTNSTNPRNQPNQPNPYLAIIKRMIRDGLYDDAFAECRNLIADPAYRLAGYQCRSMVYAARRKTDDIARALADMQVTGQKRLILTAGASDSPISIKVGSDIIATFGAGNTIEAVGIQQDRWLAVVRHNGRDISGFIRLSDLERNVPARNSDLERAREMIDSATDTQHLDEVIHLLEPIGDPVSKPQADQMRAEAMLMLGKIPEAFAIARSLGAKTITLRHTCGTVRLATTGGTTGATLYKNDRITVDISYVNHPHLKIIAIGGDSRKTGYLLISSLQSHTQSYAHTQPQYYGPDTWSRTGLGIYKHNLTGREWTVMMGTLTVQAAQKAVARKGFRLPTRSEVIHAIQHGMKSNISGMQRNVWTTSGLMDTQTGQIVRVMDAGFESTLGIR